MEPARAELHRPGLEELANVLQNGLEKHFKIVSVSVVECPNLLEEPFHLAAKGIGGNPRLVDIGGVPYLLPTPQKDKIYDLKTVAKDIGLPEAFFIGAGAGPRHQLGVNCELIPNLKVGKVIKNETHGCKITKDGGYELLKIDSTDTCLLANVFASEGEKGPVIKVIAKHRLPDATNFVTAMRTTLLEEYGEEKSVGMGGVFLLKNGKAKCHVMPDYSETPIKTDQELNQWLRFFEMSGPLICLSTFISSDPGLDLRVEHTHCFSKHGQGGHYHYDLTPDTVEYEGYFNPAEFIYRVDPPLETHMIGRD